MQTMGVARMTLSKGAAGELAGVRRRSLDGLSGRLAAGAHTSRAYLAGLGTTGCLLACAGLLFLVASAIVSFSGWPQVGAPSSPVPVTVPGDGAGGGRSTTGRALAAGLRATSPAGSKGSSGAAVRARTPGSDSGAGGADRSGAGARRGAGGFDRGQATNGESISRLGSRPGVPERSGSGGDLAGGSGWLR